MSGTRSRPDEVFPEQSRLNAGATAGAETRSMNSAVAIRTDEADTIVKAFSARPRDLPCVTCGRTLSAHAGDTPDCPGFVQPFLPVGFAYVDELEGGDGFQFLTPHGRASSRVAVRAPFDLDPATGLLQLESHTLDSTDVIHLVERNTIIHRTEGSI